MTTKFAACFLLILPCSAMTSMILLLILTGSWIDMLLTPLLRSDFGFLGSFAAALVALCTGSRNFVSYWSTTSASSRTFGSLLFCHEIVWTGRVEVEGLELGVLRRLLLRQGEVGRSGLG